MTTKQKTDIIRILEQSKGDDLYRAKMAFKYMTPDQMGQQWGHSGKSCQEILDGYVKHEEQINELIAAVRNA